MFGISPSGPYGFMYSISHKCVPANFIPWDTCSLLKSRQEGTSSPVVLGAFPTTQEPPPQALLSVSPKRLQVLVQWPRIQGQSQGMWILTLSSGSSSYSWSVPRSFSFLTSTMGSNLGSDTEESDVETIPLRLKKELHPPLRWPILLPEGSEHSNKASFPWGSVSLSSECEACKDIVESVLGEKLLFEVRRPAEKPAEKPILDELLR